MRWPLLLAAAAAVGVAEADEVDIVRRESCFRHFTVLQFKNEVNNPLAFCRYWTLISVRKQSPIHGMSANAIYNACSCLLPKPEPPLKPEIFPDPPVSCIYMDPRISALRYDLKHPDVFCRYWRNCFYTRKRTPFDNLSPAQISSVCSCANKTPALLSSTSSSSRTRKVTTTHRLTTTYSVTTTRTSSSESTSGSAGTTAAPASTSTVRAQSSVGISIPQKTTGANSMSTPILTSAAATYTPLRQVTTSSRTTTASTTSAKTSSQSQTAVPTTKLKAFTPSNVDRSDMANLQPASAATLYFADPSTMATTGLASTADLTFTGSVVNLDYSSLVKSIDCEPDGSARVVFTGAAAVQYASQQWSQHFPLTILTSTSCSKTGTSSISPGGWDTNAVTFVDQSGLTMAQSPYTADSYMTLSSLPLAPVNASAVTSRINLAVAGLTGSSNTSPSIGFDWSYSGKPINSEGPVTAKSPWGNQLLAFKELSSSKVASDVSMLQQIKQYLTGSDTLKNDWSVWCLDCTFRGSASVVGTLQQDVNGNMSASITVTGASDSAHVALAINALRSMEINHSNPNIISFTSSIIDGGQWSLVPTWSFDISSMFTNDGIGQMILSMDLTSQYSLNYDSRTGGIAVASVKSAVTSTNFTIQGNVDSQTVGTFKVPMIRSMAFTLGSNTQIVQLRTTATFNISTVDPCNGQSTACSGTMTGTYTLDESLVAVDGTVSTYNSTTNAIAAVPYGIQVTSFAPYSTSKTSSISSGSSATTPSTAMTTIATP